MGLIGYARISTIEGAQVLDRQLDALNAAGCERIFEDRASGAKAERPGLSACLDFLRKDDVLVVLDLDRLGRLAGELITLIDQLATRGVAFRALNAPMPSAKRSSSTPSPYHFSSAASLVPAWVFKRFTCFQISVSPGSSSKVAIKS